MSFKNSDKTYLAPSTKVVKIKAQAIICQSVCGINSMSIDEEDGGELFN